MRRRIKCEHCGERAVELEVIEPGARRAGWWKLSRFERRHVARHRRAGVWYRRYSGPGGHNGPLGDEISADAAMQLVSDLTEPALDIAVLGLDRPADGYCDACAVHYCARCWSIRNGYGTCPHGHGRTIDPHWSPGD